MPDQNGAGPADYRVATLLFASMEKMQQGLGSPEGQALVADLDNFGRRLFVCGDRGTRGR